jgi:hypothetical protein
VGREAAGVWGAAFGPGQPLAHTGDGQGAQFEDRDECEVKARDFFQGAWTENNCPSIDEDGREKCLDRIRSTSCSSGTDFLNTSFVVCGADAVCEDDED